MGPGPWLASTDLQTRRKGAPKDPAMSSGSHSDVRRRCEPRSTCDRGFQPLAMPSRQASEQQKARPFPQTALSVMKRPLYLQAQRMFIPIQSPLRRFHNVTNIDRPMHKTAAAPGSV